MSAIAELRTRNFDKTEAPTTEELVQRAEFFIPQLRSEQAESNDRGCYSPDMHEKFQNAGFYKICQPRKYGGYEHSLKTFYKVMIAVSTGHPAAGWCLTLGASHAFVLASHWSEKAQDEAFASGEFIAPHRATPTGEIKRVDGGYQVSGRWRYASGVPYSTHFIGNALIDDGEGNQKEVAFIVPRKDYEILGDWGGGQTVGMCASGSNSVLLEDVFVPDHMFTDWEYYYARPDDMKDGTVGAHLHDNPMYLGRLMGPYHISLVAPVIGAARAAIEEYESSLHRQQTLFPPFMARKDQHDFQRNFGNAIRMTDCAEQLVYAACDQYDALCERWKRTSQTISLEENLRIWGVAQQAGKLACDVVELLYQTAGSSASRKGHPLAQYMGDAQMYRGHVSSQYSAFGGYIAQARLGLPVDIDV